MYLDHLQNWLDYGLSLLIFLGWTPLWLVIWTLLGLCHSQGSLFEPRFLSQGCIFGKYSLAKGISFFRSPLPRVYFLPKWPKISPRITTKIMSNKTRFRQNHVSFWQIVHIKLNIYIYSKRDNVAPHFCYDFSGVLSVDCLINSGPCAKSRGCEKFMHDLFLH